MNCSNIITENLNSSEKQIHSKYFMSKITRAIFLIFVQPMFVFNFVWFIGVHDEVVEYKSYT